MSIFLRISENFSGGTLANLSCWPDNEIVKRFFFFSQQMAKTIVVTDKNQGSLFSYSFVFPFKHSTTFSVHNG